MNALISSSLLYTNKKEITFKEIKENTKTAYQYIQEKRLLNYISSPPQNFEINQHAINLGFTVKGDPLKRKTGDEAVINLELKEQQQKMLSLSYYGN